LSSPFHQEVRHTCRLAGIGLRDIDQAANGIANFLEGDGADHGAALGRVLGQVADERLCLTTNMVRLLCRNGTGAMVAQATCRVAMLST
jgi:hypothetical protein